MLSVRDPFIGTGGHGYTFAGTTVSFGVIQPGPDNGRGAGDWSSRFYQLFLEDSKIQAVCTASEDNAFYRYDFHLASIQSVDIDLIFSINWNPTTNTRLTLENDTIIIGYCHSSGWASNQKVFFEFQFSKSIIKYRMGRFRDENGSIPPEDPPVYSTLCLWGTYPAEHPLLTLIGANHESNKNFHIQSAGLIGKDFNRTSISQQEIIQGGVLTLPMDSGSNKERGINN